jgi:hypothetical protein
LASGFSGGDTTAAALGERAAAGGENYCQVKTGRDALPGTDG